MPETAWLPSGRRAVMGVLNITPDSFSGDGLQGNVERAVERGTALAAAGADVIDVGGESTRPGYHPVDEREEAARVVPVIRALASTLSIPISVDTGKANVARRALEAGATIVNDVTGLRDPLMVDVVARRGAGLILVHWGVPPEGQDVVASIAASLRDATQRVLDAGMKRQSMVIDPGLGMGGKDWRHNFVLMRRLPELLSLGLPIAIGPSRKGMIGRVLHVPVEDRLEGSLALVALCLANGASLVRVHDVAPAVEVARMIDAVLNPPTA